MARDINLRVLRKRMVFKARRLDKITKAMKYIWKKGKGSMSRKPGFRRSGEEASVKQIGKGWTDKKEKNSV